ncbi:MAG: hypothetical protein KH452_11490 [Clostridiales bacterium]|nr:hypothetical protein [Clostridiales bacterium]
MNKRERKHTGKSFCGRKRQKNLLQTPHVRKRSFHTERMLPLVHRRISLCAFQRGSLTLETALVLPLLLYAVMALLYIYTFTGVQAVEYQKLMERAKLLAVTVGQGYGEDPYIRLSAPVSARLPFPGGVIGGRLCVQRVTVRAWTGYTGETFRNGASGEMVYLTPEGTVCHRSRDCTYLRLSVRTLPVVEVEEARNHSGGRYDPCEYCVTASGTGAAVYITDYGTSYHSRRECQGLKRTVMSVPWSEAGGLPLCSRCGGS